MSGKRLTARDMQTIASALCNAQDERESFADAYGGRGPVAKQALDWVKRYEKLYVKIFGKPSPRTETMRRFAAAPSVSIHDLAALNPTPERTDDEQG